MPMLSSHLKSSRLVLGLVLLASAACLLGAGENGEREFTPRQCKPSRVVGDDTCAKCHESELKQWRQTPHYRTFDTLHRTPEAKAIADRMGLRSIKRNDTCVTCHYTRQLQGTRLRVV
ncbi:MAG: multiheme c-type cytochrome, partial [Aeoliella sp.]